MQEEKEKGGSYKGDSQEERKLEITWWKSKIPNHEHNQDGDKYLTLISAAHIQTIQNMKVYAIISNNIIMKKRLR